MHLLQISTEITGLKEKGCTRQIFLIFRLISCYKLQQSVRDQPQIEENECPYENVIFNSAKNLIP
jgi:hypothetical protein